MESVIFIMSTSIICLFMTTFVLHYSSFGMYAHCFRMSEFYVHFISECFLNKTSNTAFLINLKTRAHKLAVQNSLTRHERKNPLCQGQRWSAIFRSNCPADFTDPSELNSRAIALPSPLQQNWFRFHLCALRASSTLIVTRELVVVIYRDSAT